MKKLLVLVLTIFLANQLQAQLTGSYSGQNNDTWMINWDYTAGADANLRLSTKTSNVKRSWNIFHESSDNDLYFSFSNNVHDPQHIGSKRMVLTDAGYLAIGSDSPGNRLDVNGGIDMNDYIRHRGDLDTFFGFHGNDQFRIKAKNEERLFINSSGNVGLGTLSPGYKLDVSGDIRATASLKLSGTGTIFESTNTGVQTFKFTNDNLIGVNTIEIADPGENEGITWAGTGAKIFVSPLNSGSTDGYLRVINDGGISFEGGSEDREDMLISSNGKVGIGTTSPGEKLHINGDIRTSSGQINSESGSIKLMEGIRADDSTYEWTGFYSGSKRQGIILYDGAWNGANNRTDEFSITAENGNIFTLNTDGNHIALMPKSTGNVGVGTTSPDEKLSVIGKLSLANTADETSDYIQLYHDGEANVSTEEGALHFRKGNDKYLVAEQVADTAVTRIHSYGQPLVLRGRALPDVPDPADPLGDLSIKDDGTVVIHNGFELEGNFNLTNTELGNEDEYVLSLGAGDEIRRRSVESLTPWVIRQVYHDADTVDVLSCSPHADGEECGCPEGAHVTIDASDVIDIEGNLALGDQGFIDNDQVAGPNLDETTGEKTVNDDYIRIQESIEFSSSSTTRGLVLLDNTVGSGKFLNFFHDDGISYFSNSTNSTPDADFFMKAGTGTPAEKNQITFADRVTFNNGFVTSSYTSPNAMNFAMDTDNTGEDALFKVGRGTQDINDETNWFGLFYVDKDGVATFSSDIGDNQNPNRIIIDGSQGTGTFSGQLNLLGNSDIVTGSFGTASNWKVAYDSRMIAGDGLAWNNTTKDLSVRLGDGLKLNSGGEIATHFVEDATDQLSYSGSLAVGTTQHYGYELAVGGDIVAEEINLKLEEDWPDYVFEDNYKLEPLAKTEKYIAKNKHLPDMPSASEVATEGVNLGEMNALLLKKIEEMTLHMIQMEKRIQELENK